MVLAGCGSSLATRTEAVLAPGPFKDVVVSAPATSVTVAGAVALDDGGLAVLACVERS